MGYKVCAEHMDMAIDQYVDDYELAPEIRLVNQDEKLSTTCEFCQNDPIYIVGN